MWLGGEQTSIDDDHLQETAHEDALRERISRSEGKNCIPLSGAAGSRRHGEREPGKGEKTEREQKLMSAEAMTYNHLKWSHATPLHSCYHQLLDLSTAATQNFAEDAEQHQEVLDAEVLPDDCFAAE